MMRWELRKDVQDCAVWGQDLGMTLQWNIGRIGVSTGALPKGREANLRKLFWSYEMCSEWKPLLLSLPGFSVHRIAMLI